MESRKWWRYIVLEKQFRNMPFTGTRPVRNSDQNIPWEKQWSILTA